MKILVFDDTLIHRKAAAALLKGHEVTIVSTYDDAQEALTTHVDQERKKQLLVEAGYPNGYVRPEKNTMSKEEEEARWQVFRAADIEAEEKATVHPSFDVVMTDLMVEPSSRALADPSDFANQEMPLGSIIALLAIHNGVKKVAVVTDMNHHKHPASAAFDAFGRTGVSDNNGLKLFCTNGALCSIDAETFEKVDRRFLESPAGEEKYPLNKQSYKRTGLVSVKAWDWILQLLCKNDARDQDGE